MPQLDVSTYPSQLFWLGVCFLALYGLLVTLILPKLTGTLKEREEEIGKKITEASTFREEAENLLSEYEDLLEKARREGQEKYKEFSEVIGVELAEKQKEFLDKLNERLHIAEQDLYRARLEASQELTHAAEDIANGILEKIVPHSSGLKKEKK